MSQNRNSFELVYDELEIKKTSFVNMHKQIKETIKDLHKNNVLINQIFLFAHVNILCKTRANVYLPCELSIGEYSIMTGITKVFHAFIRPRDVPIGYAFLIQTIASKSHLIEMDTPPMNYPSSSNYADIAKKIKEMIKREDGSVLPIYALEENVKEVENCLSDIFQWSGIESPFKLKIKVFCLHLLFFELDNILKMEECLKFQRTSDANDKLSDFTYSHIRKLACRYHEKQDRKIYCSAFQVHKWAFTFSDHLCNLAGVKMIFGAHKPKDTRRNKKGQNYQFPSFSSSNEPGETAITSCSYIWNPI